MNTRLLLAALCLAAPATALAKAKKKPRVLIFDPSDRKKRPQFAYPAMKPQDVSKAPIFFTTVSPAKGEDGDEPGDVTVKEKDLMLDQGKTK
jgi:hypothetical protein